MSHPPREPEPSSWSFPSPLDAEDELVAVGGDLTPGSLLAAYRSGLFPMPLSTTGDPELDSSGLIGWWSPDPRGILELDALRITRSTRRSQRSYRVTFNTGFEQVMRECADPRRDGGWINEEFIAAYSELFRLGWARSVEVWAADGGSAMVGGLYGVSIGGFFAGESMFARRRDASKIALIALVERLRSEQATLLDVQWCTDHLRTLGATEIPRREYVARLSAAVG